MGGFQESKEILHFLNKYFYYKQKTKQFYSTKKKHKKLYNTI